jgi:hypothetical protein
VAASLRRNTGAEFPSAADAVVVGFVWLLSELTRPLNSVSSRFTSLSTVLSSRLSLVSISPLDHFSFHWGNNTYRQPTFAAARNQKHSHQQWPPATQTLLSVLQSQASGPSKNTPATTSHISNNSRSSMNSISSCISYTDRKLSMPYRTRTL